jgi:hypothetical protein
MNPIPCKVCYYLAAGHMSKLGVRSIFRGGPRRGQIEFAHRAAALRAPPPIPPRAAAPIRGARTSKPHGHIAKVVAQHEIYHGNQD